MLYIIAIIAGILAGVLAGGRIGNLLKFRFNKPIILILAFAIQSVASILGLKGIGFVNSCSLIIQGVVYTLLFIGFWLNRHYFGLCVVAVGGFLNAAVMMLNGGKMPVDFSLLTSGVSTEAIELLKSGADGKHTAITESTRLVFLADVFHPPGILSWSMQVISIGDMIVVLGLFVVVLEIVVYKELRVVNGKLGLVERVN